MFLKIFLLYHFLLKKTSVERGAYKEYNHVVMDFRQIIKTAWEFTQEHKSLIRWYGFVPALLTILVGSVYMAYQVISIVRSPFFANTEHGFMREVVSFIFNYWKESPQLTTLTIIVAIVIILLYLVIPTFCQGALIQLTARLKNGQPVKTISDGITYGLFSFLPLFEYHILVKTFSIISLFTEAAFVVRNLGPDWFNLLLIPFVLMVLIGIVLTLLFTYTDYFIVIDKDPIFTSIGKSCRLVLMHWQETLLMLMLMVIIGIRIIVNIAIMLLIPIMMIFLGGYLATITVPAISFWVVSSIGFVSLIFATYFSAVLTVFANAVWVFTFLALTTKIETTARDVMPSR